MNSRRPDLDKTTDEQMATGLPPAYRPHLALIACTKRWLMSDDLPASERLYYLEQLNQMIWGSITAEALAAIAPASADFESVVAEAMKLDAGRADDHCPAAFAALEDWAVFSNLLRLNPSLATAAGMCKGRKAA
jgi:hypothetical protein